MKHLKGLLFSPWQAFESMNPSEPKQLKSVSWKLPHEKPQLKLNIMKESKMDPKSDLRRDFRHVLALKTAKTGRHW